MTFLSLAIAEEHSRQRDVGFVLLGDRDVEGCWRRMVLRPLLASSAARLQVTLCELVEIEPRLVKDSRATECEEETKMISRATVFIRQN